MSTAVTGWVYLGVLRHFCLENRNEILEPYGTLQPAVGLQS
jgi:hypothetical protein